MICCSFDEREDVRQRRTGREGERADVAQGFEPGQIDDLIQVLYDDVAVDVVQAEIGERSELRAARDLEGLHHARDLQALEAGECLVLGQDQAAEQGLAGERRQILEQRVVGDVEPRSRVDVLQARKRAQRGQREDADLVRGAEGFEAVQVAEQGGVLDAEASVHVDDAKALERGEVRIARAGRLRARAGQRTVADRKRSIDGVQAFRARAGRRARRS